MFSKTNLETIRARGSVHIAIRSLLKALLITLVLGYGLTAFCDTEPELKANFIYTFAKSAEVPKDRLGDGAGPYVIGVFGGDSDFVDVLREAAAGKAVGSHQIKIKRLSSEAELGQCNLVYFNAARKRTAEALRTVPAGIVLVGEDLSFLGDGGMINLVADHGKLRFEVNRGALDKGDVRLDQKLLALARVPNEPTGLRRVRSNVTPVYPDVARRMAIKGTVQLKVKVSGEGVVRGVDVVGGNPVLVEALVSAVKQWRFESTGRDTVELVKYTFD
jgi:TonB family protein